MALTREKLNAIRERENQLCLRCGRVGQDVAHILPRRFTWAKEDKRNMVFLCRQCHKATETFEGRGELIALLMETYGYEYPEPEFQRRLKEYLR
jgi:5-methylcytosine-specific restriction endonuclease McrA